jgi:hypothetical protein
MILLKQGYTQPEFRRYVELTVARKMAAWRPRGCVLHNTWAPRLSQWPGIVNGKPISEAQRIENMSVCWIRNGWSSGPHLFVAPDKVWTATPLWQRGTHSPSWNSTHWGIELVGEYDTEKLPDSLRENAVHAMACLYAMLGREPSEWNFKFHGEDPRTSHKHCPGKAVHPKAWWERAIEDRMASMHPGEDYERS